MSALVWDQLGEKLFETGVSNGVIYPISNGSYGTGYAWNGLSAVTESPSGAEPTAVYADNAKYAELTGAEDFGFTIEAYTYPPQFAECDGTKELVDGMFIGQQPRKKFGFVYKTLIGNDTDGTSKGYKLHIIYNATAKPSEKAYSTVNESPETVSFSWECSTTPITMNDGTKLCTIVIDSTQADPDKLAALELTLFGDTSSDPELPTPDAIKTALTPST